MVPDGQRPAAPAGFSEDVLGSMACPVLVVYGDGRILYANPAAEQAFGASAAALGRRPLADFLPAGSPLMATLARVRRDGSSAAEYGVRLRAPSLSERPVDVRASPCQDDPDLLVLTLHAGSLAERLGGHRLGQLGAARSATGFADTLSHEIRNPLSGIRGAAQLLAEVVGPGDRELTRLICEETDRIGALLARFDSFADGATAAARPVNIHSVLDRVYMVASNGFARDARFKRAYDPSLPAVPGDRDRLVQAFLNLVKNAAEAAPGGCIRLATGFRHGLRMRTAGAGRKLPVYVAVEDDGPGIPPDIRGLLFEPFVTTRTGGRGLGLALVARVVEDHGGVVEVEDGPGGGTRFTVYLPASDAGAAAGPGKEAAA